jgi:hypothetical protein
MSNCKAGAFRSKSAWLNPNLRYFHLPRSHGGRSSTVEPRIVVPDVAGSNPVGHPAISPRKIAFYRENRLGVKALDRPKKP